MKGHKFLLFLAQLPATPSSLRVMVWRQMRDAGAVNLPNGAWVLPRSPAGQRFLDELLAVLVQRGASGQIFAAKPLKKSTLDEVVSRSRLDRDLEYAEFCNQCEAFLAQVDGIGGMRDPVRIKGIEGRLKRLAHRLEVIQGRDFFEGEQAGQAQAALQACQQALTTMKEGANPGVG
jgi:hypothetical protein